MPLVGVNNEPLLERAVFGYDGSNYRVVKLDTDGNIVVALKAEEDVQANGYGWISSAWQKQPLNIGYSGAQDEQKITASASAGTNTLQSTAVPSGEIWRLQAVNVVNNTSSATQWEIRVVVGGVTIYLLYNQSPTAGLNSLWSGDLVLSPADYVLAAFFGCTAGDQLILSYHAIRVDTDQ